MKNQILQALTLELNQHHPTELHLDPPFGSSTWTIEGKTTHQYQLILRDQTLTLCNSTTWKHYDIAHPNFPDDMINFITQDQETQDQLIKTHLDQQVMNTHTFYLIAIANTGLYYRRGTRNKGKHTATGREPKQAATNLVQPQSATHYPNEEFADQAVAGIFREKGRSYQAIKTQLKRIPTKKDIIITRFKAESF